MQKHYQPGFEFMMWDGASFDAHQHKSLLEAVDNQCIKKLLKPMCKELGLTIKEYNEILKHAMNTRANFNMYYPKSRKKLMTGSIEGTTFTGHPLRTTLGNTLRMFFYTRYAMHYCKNIKDIVQFHAGDDVLLMGPKD
jgi:hypothetical protein